MNHRDDRMVHAWGDHSEVVRYDRTGKWYIEPKNGLSRTQVSLADAVEHAMWAWYQDNGSVEIGRPGGKLFDKRIQDACRAHGTQEPEPDSA